MEDRRSTEEKLREIRIGRFRARARRRERRETRTGTRLVEYDCGGFDGCWGGAALVREGAEADPAEMPNRDELGDGANGGKEEQRPTSSKTHGQREDDGGN